MVFCNFLLPKEAIPFFLKSASLRFKNMGKAQILSQNATPVPGVVPGEVHLKAHVGGLHHHVGTGIPVSTPHQDLPLNSVYHIL